MKHLFRVLMALLLAAVMATPAFAQGPVPPGRTGQLCMGGNMTVQADPTYTPEYVTAFGCNVIIAPGARVSGDVAIFGGNVTLEAKSQITGDLVIFGGNVDTAGEVTRDIAVFGGNVILESSAVVGRDVVAFGGYVQQKEGASVHGRVSRGTSFRGFPMTGNWSFALPVALGSGMAGAMTSLALSIIRNIVYALALAALGALTVVFMPAQTRQVSDTAQKSAMESIGVGCLTSFVAVTLGTLLIITLCGIPFGVLVLLALVVAWIFGWIALGRLTGEKLLEAIKVREILPIVAVVVGVLVLTIVGFVPIIGWLVGLFIGLLGLGAVVLTRFGTRAYPTLTPALATSTLAPTPAAIPSTPPAPSAPAPTNEPTPPGEPGGSN